MVVTVMTVMAPMAATVHAVAAMAMTMSAMTTVAARRSGSNGSSGQSERGSSCEGEFTKHILRSPCARRDCLTGLFDVASMESVRNIFLNGYSESTEK